MKKPRLVPREPEIPPCKHSRAYLIVNNGLPSPRVSDGKPIAFCPDCGKASADIEVKE